LKNAGLVIKPAFFFAITISFEVFITPNTY